MQSIENKFVEYFNKLKKEDKIAIIHDADPDGTCSAAIITRLLKKISREPALVISHTGAKKFTSLEIKKLKQNNINKVITVDISFDEGPEEVQKVEKFAELLIIDHHALFNNITSSNTILFKPQLFVTQMNPAKYCSAKLCYDFGNKIADLSESDWIAVVGLISDIGADAFPEFVNKVFQKYQLKTPKINSKDLFKTKIGQISILISNALVYSEQNATQAYKTLLESKNYKDIFKSPLKKYSTIIQKEINHYVKKFKSKDELAIYAIHSKYNIKSPICTILALKHPNKTIITYTVRDKIISISGRRNDYKVDMSSLFSAITKKIPNSTGGGHIPAAGAQIPAKYLAKFLKLISNEIHKYPKKTTHNNNLSFSI